MIAFTTLFLGLILGVRPVELTVGDGVTAVEILLNGRQVAVLTEAPWRVDCDFGDELAPQELVAVARDAGGREIDRVRRWINMPQPPAQVTVVLDGGGDAPRVARLAWESRIGDRPRAMKVSFDGVPLAVEDPRRIVLPPHDERQLHFLRAELEFSDQVASVAEVTFGGTYSDQVSTELSAVPVLTRKKKFSKPEAFAGLLRVDGEPLQVVAVDKGPALAVIVPDHASFEAVDQLSRIMDVAHRPLQHRALLLREYAALHRDQSVRFIWPIAERQGNERRAFDLFPPSALYDEEVGGLYYLLSLGSLRPAEGEQRLADAVAVAGLHAAEQRQRRAVVLLLGSDGEADPSQLTPRLARGYLERLRVPLYVWSFVRPSGPSPWGDVEVITRLDDLRAAADKLAKALDRQRLVWLDGVHLPQKIELAPGVKGLELAR